MDARLCPFCSKSMKKKRSKTFKYDPVLSVVEVVYHCPGCGHEEKQEYLKPVES